MHEILVQIHGRAPLKGGESVLVPYSNYPFLHHFFKNSVFFVQHAVLSAQFDGTCPDLFKSKRAFSSAARLFPLKQEHLLPFITLNCYQ